MAKSNEMGRQTMSDSVSETEHLILISCLNLISKRYYVSGDIRFHSNLYETLISGVQYVLTGNYYTNKMYA